jgi:hypothetical protein
MSPNGGYEDHCDKYCPRCGSPQKQISRDHYCDSPIPAHELEERLKKTEYKIKRLTKERDKCADWLKEIVEYDGIPNDEDFVRKLLGFLKKRKKLPEGITIPSKKVQKKRKK